MCWWMVGWQGDEGGRGGGRVEGVSHSYNWSTFNSCNSSSTGFSFFSFGQSESPYLPRSSSHSLSHTHTPLFCLLVPHYICIGRVLAVLLLPIADRRLVWVIELHLCVSFIKALPLFIARSFIQMLIYDRFYWSEREVKIKTDNCYYVYMVDLPTRCRRSIYRTVV